MASMPHTGRPDIEYDGLCEHLIAEGHLFGPCPHCPAAGHQAPVVDDDDVWDGIAVARVPGWWLTTPPSAEWMRLDQPETLANAS